MKKILIVLYFLFFTIGIISCNGQDNKSSKSTKIENQETNAQIPNLFDGKYFHGFQLSPNSDFPIYTHIDKNLGDLTVSFINKEFEKQKDWDQFDWKNDLVMEEEATPEYTKKLNQLIKNKLEKNLDNYHIIAEFVPSKYIKPSANDLNYIYPYIKTYYLYNINNKNWEFLKEKSVNDGSDEKNITKLAELISMAGITQKEKIENKSLHSLQDSWKEEGYKIAFEKLGDINQDGVIDKIVVLERDSDHFPKPFLTKVILLDRDEKAINVYSNENIIAPCTGNSYAEGLMDIAIKKWIFYL